MTENKPLCELGDTPPPRHVPRQMYASLIRQERLQGSRFANTQQCRGLNNMVPAGQVDPALARVLSLEEAGLAYQLPHENSLRPGNLAIRVMAPNGR